METRMHERERIPMPSSDITAGHLHFGIIEQASIHGSGNYTYSLYDPIPLTIVDFLADHLRTNGAENLDQRRYMRKIWHSIALELDYRFRKNSEQSSFRNESVEMEFVIRDSSIIDYEVRAEIEVVTIKSWDSSLFTCIE